MSRILLVIVLLVFGVYSTYALVQVGYVGIWTSHLHVAGIQVLSDLVIALGLVCVWMVIDARERGTNAWPFVAATLLLGSFGPLLYLLVGRARTASPLAA